MRHNNILLNILSVLGLCFFIFIAFGSSDSDSGDSGSSKSSETVYNSSWDGSVRQVERFLKTNLKDPDSFEAIEWSPVNKQSDGSFMVRCKYRAKNSFGGYIIENQIFYLDSRGNVTNYIDM